MTRSSLMTLGVSPPPSTGAYAKAASNGLRRSSRRALGEPTTPEQISAVVAADLKRKWRLIRNRNVLAKPGAVR